MRCILIALLTFVSLQAPAGELEQRREIQQIVLELFDTEQYAELDALARQYRNSNERTSSGLWKLALFYKAFEAYLLQNNAAPEPFWGNFKLKLDSYNNQQPRSATAAIVTAVFFENYALHFRGRGYVSRVNPDDWAPFYENMNMATIILDQSKEYAALDPEWYARKAANLTWLGASEEEFALNLREGLSVFPEYHNLYFAGVNHYSPHWYGSHLDIEKFANLVVSLTQEEHGYSMYARIYWSAARGYYRNGKLFSDSMVDWPRMRQGIFDVIEDHPDQWNIQNFAYFTCIRGDAETLRKLYKMMDPTPIDGAWTPISLFTNCRAIAGLLQE